MKYFLLWCLVLSSTKIFGQETLIGKVVDANEQMIDYVNIINLKQGTHTHTDRKGQFVLENNSVGDTIEISHLAYNDLVLVLTEDFFKKEQVFELQSNNFNINEVVVLLQQLVLKQILSILLKNYCVKYLDW